jgi:hypothetical protein
MGGLRISGFCPVMREPRSRTAQVQGHNLSARQHPPVAPAPLFLKTRRQTFSCTVTRCAAFDAGASIRAANHVSNNATTLTAAATHGNVSSE